MFCYDRDLFAIIIASKKFICKIHISLTKPEKCLNNGRFNTFKIYCRYHKIFLLFLLLSVLHCNVFVIRDPYVDHALQCFCYIIHNSGLILISYARTTFSIAKVSRLPNSNSFIYCFSH
jgi:hypothetical protein